MGLDLPFEPVRSGLFYSLRLGGTWVAADYWLHYFEIDRCDAVIRLEHLEDDANQLIRPLLPEGIPKLVFGHHNTKNYPRMLRRYFNYSDIRRVYQSNPLWKEWERKCYGCETQFSVIDRIFGIGHIIK